MLARPDCLRSLGPRMPWDPLFRPKSDLVDRELRPETGPHLLMRPRDARTSRTIFTRARGSGERLHENQALEARVATSADYYCNMLQTASIYEWLVKHGHGDSNEGSCTLAQMTIAGAVEAKASCEPAAACLGPFGGRPVKRMGTAAGFHGEEATRAAHTRYVARSKGGQRAVP